jgi:hypothetical protein
MEYNFNGAFAAGVAGGIAEALADPLSAPHRRVATQLRGNSFWQHWCNANIPLFAEITATKEIQRVWRGKKVRLSIRRRKKPKSARKINHNR